MLADFVKENQLELRNSSLVILTSYLIYSFVIYPLFFHPLAKIPGPKICALTKYWILYISGSRQRNRYVEKLHNIYGPIVRVGPSEIDICEASYIKDVYVKNFDKTTFYAQFSNYGTLNTFSTIDKAVHRDSRKASAKFYSKTSIMSEPVQQKVNNIMSSLLKVIDGNQDTEINCFYLWAIMAMDGVTSFSFGAKYYKPLLSDPFNFGKMIIDNFLHQSSSWFWTTSMPEWYDYVVPQSVGQSTAIVAKWISDQFEESLANVDNHECETLVSTILGGSKKSMFDAMRAKSESFDHIAAGHNTTATTLSYLYYELARDPIKQDRLAQELKSFNNGKPIETNNYESFNYADIEDLPYLSALVNETFRRYAAIPGQEPRVVPKSGLKWRGSAQTPPAMIPGGTTVTMQPYSLHRTRGVFDDAHIFNPDRWLVEDEEKLKTMHNHMMQFGAGSRMCMGMHLAICEIKLSVANVISRYRVELVDGYDYRKIRQRDIWTTVPDSTNVPIIFKARS